MKSFPLKNRSSCFAYIDFLGVHDPTKPRSMPLILSEKVRTWYVLVPVTRKKSKKREKTDDTKLGLPSGQETELFTIRFILSMWLCSKIVFRMDHFISRVLQKFNWSWASPHGLLALSIMYSQARSTNNSDKNLRINTMHPGRQKKMPAIIVFQDAIKTPLSVTQKVQNWGFTECFGKKFWKSLVISSLE